MKQLIAFPSRLVRILAVPVLFFLSHALVSAQAHGGESPIEGRWDITMMVDGKPLPSWLEVMHSGTHHLVGAYVGVVGSARPVSKISFENEKMSFTIPPQWEKEDNDLSFEATFQGDSLVGSVVAADGKTHPWSGHRAPLLHRESAPSWGKAMPLLKGNQLQGWHALGENQWELNNGVLKSAHSGSNLVTDEKYNDFKLHLEFKCPKGSNSGVYLRGRYEVQIEDSKGKQPQKDLMGAVYGFLLPNEMAAKDASEWQTYDITLVGRTVNIVANGKNIICNQVIPGITGGALDSQEGEPGPLMLQGDHGAIEYRNIVITPAK